MRLRPDPDLFDRDAWNAYLDELRADELGEYRDMLIELAEGHIQAIWGDPEKTAAEAA